jgi:hypothetical protein
MPSILILDCPPGATRPNDVLKEILYGLELNEKDFVVVSKGFGEWTFQVSSEKEDYYVSQLPVIVPRIKNAYDTGMIRYADWSFHK